jgi:hypothetical protein
MRIKLGLLSAGLAALVAVSGAPPASAGDSGGHSGDAATVVASGLASPRGLAIRGGNLYIAQAGTGATDASPPCTEGPEGPACLGATGKISAMNLRTGTVRDLVTGLPSLGGQSDIPDAVGPSDVAVDGIGQVWATIGLGGIPSRARADLGDTPLVRMLGTEGKVRNGKFIVRGNPAEFEEANNPDGVTDPVTGLPNPDSNPNSLVTTGGGSVMVADAGGNSLVNVHTRGNAEAVAIFPFKPTVMITVPDPTDPTKTIQVPIDPQPVPASITRGADGTFYIGELTGFPFVPGTAAVWKWRPGQAPSIVRGDFTNIIDVAVMKSGDLLVLEIAANGLLASPPPPEGALFMLSKDGSTKTQLDVGTLTAPGGMALDGDTLYISNHSTEKGKGEILRVKLG